MSHLALGKAEGQRVSLKTLYVTPNAPLNLAVWGWIPGLKMVGYTDPEAGPMDPDPTRKLNRTECDPDVTDGSAAKFHFKKKGRFRLELRMGESVWDWCRVDCDPKNHKPKAEAKGSGSGTLNVEILWSNKTKPGKNPIGWYVTVADLLLQKHGFKLNIVGGTEYTAGRALDFANDIVDQKNVGNVDGLTASVKKRSEYAKPNSLVVVCGPARQHIEEGKDVWPYQGAHIGPDDGNNGRPYAIVNTDERSPDGATLLHEVIHCAGGKHKGCRDVIGYGYRRNAIDDQIVGYLQKAFFRTE
jgi:hypothetical protein